MVKGTKWKEPTNWGQKEWALSRALPPINWLHLSAFTSKPPNPHVQTGVLTFTLKDCCVQWESFQDPVLVSLSLLVMICWSYREWSARWYILCSREATLAKANSEGRKHLESYCVPFFIVTHSLLLQRRHHQVLGLKHKGCAECVRPFRSFCNTGSEISLWSHLKVWTNGYFGHIC